MASGPAADPHRSGIDDLLAPVVDRAGMDLEAVEITPAGRRRVLRVVVDREGGVGLDDVATLSQQVAQVLDRSGAMGESPYLLEVTSPGVDRPLTEPRHWRRALDRLVQVRPHGGAEVVGRVVEADERGVVLEVGGERRRYAYPDLSAGRVQVEFRRREEGGS